MNQTWKKTGFNLLLVGVVMVSAWMGAFAAPSQAGANRSRGAVGVGFLAGLDRSVGLTPEQRDGIRGLLAEQRQASQTLRQQTDDKIRNVLTPDQQKKFDDYIANYKTNHNWRPATN